MSNVESITSKYLSNTDCGTLIAINHHTVSAALFHIYPDGAEPLGTKA